VKSRQPLPGEDQEFLPAELHACGVLAPLPFIVIQAPQMAVAPIPGEVTGFLGGEHRRGAGAGMDGLEETTGAIARTPGAVARGTQGRAGQRADARDVMIAAIDTRTSTEPGSRRTTR
jgi:hypothetical protein